MIFPKNDNWGLKMIILKFRWPRHFEDDPRDSILKRSRDDIWYSEFEWMQLNCVKVTILIWLLTSAVTVLPFSFSATVLKFSYQWFGITFSVPYIVVTNMDPEQRSGPWSVFALRNFNWFGPWSGFRSGSLGSVHGPVYGQVFLVGNSFLIFKISKNLNRT